MAETEELGLEVFVEGWRKFENIMSRLDKSIDGLEKEMESTTKTSGAFSVAIGTLAANAVAKLAEVFVDLGRKVVDFTIDSVKLAADFQDSMAILSVAASSTGLSFDELKEAALAVGGDTRLLGVSATGAAASMTGLFKAGLTTTEIFGDLNAFMAEGAELGGALRASIDLAAATELDMVQASDLAAVALASFGSELETEAERAEFITDAMDNFVKAADASVAEVSDLAAALTTVGPTASALGISLEDTNNALAILSTRGITGAQAGTSLKSMLTNLQRPTKAVQEKFNELGVSLFDTEGEFIGLRQLTADLQKSMSGMTDEQRNLTTQVLAGTFGMNAMNTLLAEGEAGWDNMADATENAAGIQEQAAVRGKTFNAQMEALEGTIETVKIRIGDALLPVATDLVKWFSAMVEEHGPALTAMFQVVGEWLKTAIPQAITTAKSFFEGVLLPAIETIWGFIRDSVIPVLSTLWEWFQTSIPSALETASGIFASVFEAIKELWDALVTQWETKLQPAFETLFAWFAEKLPGAISTVSSFWEGTLKPALETIWNFIIESLIPALGDVAAFLIENIPLAIETAATFWEETLEPAIEEVWKFITESLVPAFEAAVLWLSEKLPIAMQALETFWKETLEPAFEEIQKWLAENIPLAIETVKTFWEETLIPALETVWGYIVENIIPIFLDVVDWLQTKIPEATTALALIWENTLKPALEIVWKFIVEDLLPLFESLRKFFAEVLTLALEAISGIWENTLKPALETVWKFLVESLMPILNDLADFFKVTFVLAMEKANPILEGIEAIFGLISDAVGGVIGWINELTTKLQSITLPDWMTPGSPTPLELGLRGIASAMQEVSGLTDNLFAGAPRNIAIGANGGVSPTASPGMQVTNNVTNNNEGDQFNLSTNTNMQPGGVALEFGTMSMRSK